MKLGKKNPTEASKKRVEPRPRLSTEKEPAMVLYPGGGDQQVKVQQGETQGRGCLGPCLQIDQIKTGTHNGAMRWGVTEGGKINTQEILSDFPST